MSGLAMFAYSGSGVAFGHDLQNHPEHIYGIVVLVVALIIVAFYFRQR
jgi:lipoprotein signal peptidase